jgi:hypothetical protein
VIARVGDQYLYQTDIEGLADESEDSAQIVDAYVDNWVREQLLVRKALQNLKEEKVNFDKLIERYRRSLIIYTYENQLVKQKLDTLITDDQVRAYYTNNLNNFDSKELLYQMRFVKFLNTAPKQDSVKTWLFSRDSSFYYDLSDFCTAYALQCQLDTQLWVNHKTAKELLATVDEDVSILSSRSQVQANDSTQTILIDVFDRKKVGEPAPVSYVSEQIRGIIKNQRKIKLLADIRQQIYEDATIKNEYEIYK